VYEISFDDEYIQLGEIHSAILGHRGAVGKIWDDEHLRKRKKTTKGVKRTEKEWKEKREKRKRNARSARML
jgi:hypothetical protein